MAVTLALPVAVEQIDGGAVIADDGAGLTFTVYEVVPLQALPFVTVTL